jgi:dolichol kinase
MRQELIRKLFHLSSVGLPIFCLFLSPERMFLFVGMLASIMVSYDLARILKKDTGFLGWVNAASKKLGLSGLFRGSEARALSGGSYMLITAFILLFMIPKHVFILAFMVLAISDTLAALVGIRFGKIKFLGKSLEGALAFFISACLISWGGWSLLGTSSFFPFFMASLVATLVEAWSGKTYFKGKLRMDDNMTVPLAYSVTLAVFGGF